MDMPCPWVYAGSIQAYIPGYVHDYESGYSVAERMERGWNAHGTWMELGWNVDGKRMAHRLPNPQY